jgi:hypothetical protein
MGTPNQMPNIFQYGHLVSTGWIRSMVTGQSVDQHSNPVPWISYAAISFLEHRVSTALSVFEFGSGMSTLWWALKCKCVLSVEHDRKWIEKMAPLLPANAKVQFNELEYGGKYCQSAADTNMKFDIVSVDGRDRVNSAIFSLDALSSDGVILWDDTNRERYAPGIRFLASKGFKRIDFEGMKPCTIETTATSVFYRSNNCLGI